MAEFRVGFCVSGGGRLARAAIVNAAALGVTPALLLADHRAASDLEAFGEAHGVPVVRVARGDRQAFDDHVTEACMAASLDLLALTFQWLIQPRLIAHYPARIINVHPALLPAFPGMKALETAVGSGARFVGASIHEVDEGVDTGAVVAQCVLGLRRDDTAEAAGARMFNLLRPMFLQVVRWYAEGRVSRDAAGRLMVERATYGELPVSPAIEMAFVD